MDMRTPMVQSHILHLKPLSRQSLRRRDPRVLHQGPSDKEVHLAWRKRIVPTSLNLTERKWQEIQEAIVPHWDLQSWQTSEHQSSVLCLFLPPWFHICPCMHYLFNETGFLYLGHGTYHQKIKPEGWYTKKLSTWNDFHHLKLAKCFQALLMRTDPLSTPFSFHCNHCCWAY